MYKEEGGGGTCTCTRRREGTCTRRREGTCTRRREGTCTRRRREGGTCKEEGGGEVHVRRRGGGGVHVQGVVRTLYCCFYMYDQVVLRSGGEPGDTGVSARG